MSHQDRLHSLPRRKDYGSGVFRRRISVQVRNGLACAELEDDFHRFGVRVRSEAGRVAEISGVSSRYPWTTCPAASAQLDRLLGSELSASLPEIAERAEPASQCTHQLDLACLAIACTTLGFADRRFDAAVPELRERKASVTLDIDGARHLAWNIEGMRIAGPAPFDGLALGRPFVAWVARELEPEAALGAHVLRRATFIGFGRQYDFDAMPNPIEFAAATGSRCHSFQPGIIDQAERIVGSGRNFGDNADALLRDLEVLG